MTQGAGWDGILEPGESILWQGQPESGIAWADALTQTTPMGVIFTAFSLFWMATATGITAGGDFPFPFSMFPLFGLPFLAIGLYMLGGHVVIDAYLRSVTWYTLTDRTAFIATSVFGQKRLASYPIAAMPFLVLEDGAPGSILFAEPPPGRRQRTQTSPGRVGFHRIANAREIYRQMRGLRAGIVRTDTA